MVHDIDFCSNGTGLGLTRECMLSLRVTIII